MVQKLLQYPEPLSLEYGVNVRVFDEKLFSLIEDIKETMRENNLEALSAYQIGSYFNVIVMKDGKGEFLELINPKIISHEGEFVSEESTTYFPGKSAVVKRFDSIGVVYVDRHGEQHSLQLREKASATLQRKLDYLYGATFLSRLEPKERERFETALTHGISYDNYCPRSFLKDKIIKFSNLLVALLFFSFILSFFIDDKNLLSKIWQWQSYTAVFVVILDIFYIIYGKYEGAKYKGCTSCQLGNMIGTSAINLAKLGVVMGLAYVFIK